MILYTVTNDKWLFLFEKVKSRNLLNGLKIYGAYGMCKVIILT